MRRRPSLILASAVFACLVASGCSKPYENKELSIRWELPKGFSVHAESPESVELRKEGDGVLTVTKLSVAFDPARDAGAQWEELRKVAPGLPDARPTASSNGQVPAGPVLRYDVKANGRESVVYVVLRAQTKSALLLHLQQEPGAPQRTQQAFDSSMGSLRFL